MSRFPTRRRVPFFLLAPVAGLLLSPAPGNGQETRRFVLRYRCGPLPEYPKPIQWGLWGVEIESPRRNGEIRAYVPSVRDADWEFRGTASEDGIVTLKSRQKLDPCRNTARQPLVLSGSWSDAGVFTLTSDSPDAPEFYGARITGLLPTFQDAQDEVDRFTRRFEVERQTAQKAREEALVEARRIQRKAEGWVPPELSGGGEARFNGLMEYTDWGLKPNQFRPLQPGELPIDAANKWLYDNGYKCLHTDYVVWNPAADTVRARLSGDWMYVIECDGDCTRLRYSAAAEKPVIAQGTGQPVPMFRVGGTGWYNRTVEWRFYLPPSQRERPEIRIHAWSETMGDRGPGCSMIR